MIWQIKIDFCLPNADIGHKMPYSRLLFLVLTSTYLHTAYKIIYRIACYFRTKTFKQESINQDSLRSLCMAL